MTKQKVIPVFFTVDEKYAPYLSTAIMSLIEHTSKKYNYEINIVYSNLTLYSRNKLERLADGKKNIKIISTKMKNNLRGISDRKETRLKADEFVPAIYYRIFLPEMFPQYDRALYLDSDIIVLADVANLFNTNLEGNPIAACLDMSTFGNPLFARYFKDAIGITTKQYFNSGVLVMNFDQLRKEEFCEHFLYLLNFYDFDTVAPDQDYLNAMLKDRVTYLDMKWNTMPTAEADEKSPYIVHYNLFFKPWHYDNTKYGEYFWEYAEKSSFIRPINREKRNFGKRGRKTDDERLKQMSERCEEILASEKTFKKVFDSGKERRS